MSVSAIAPKILTLLTASALLVLASPAQAADGDVVAQQTISETQGGFTNDLDSGDRLARAATPIGDLDGDGIVDVALGAPGDDDVGNGHGAIYVVTLNADGTVKTERKISDGAGSFAGDLDFLDRFGFSVAALGDLDGDDNVDLAVGAPGDDDGGLSHGAVWILFLNAEGAVKSHTKISDTSGGFGGDLDVLDRFGTAVTCLGDVDGDGNPDLAVGASNDDSDDNDSDNPTAGAPTSAGSVWVLFLNSDGTVKAEQEIGSLTGGFDGDLDTGDAFGSALTALGDLDTDGVSELAVGATGDDDGGNDHGAVWVLFLDDDGTVKSHSKISSTSGGFAGPLDEQDRFGAGLSLVGDLDGDGTSDLGVGATEDDDGGTNVGAVWLLFMEPNGTVAGQNKLTAASGVAGLMDGDDFGRSLALLEGVGGDGEAKILAGAPRSDDGGGVVGNKGAAIVLTLEGTPPAASAFDSAPDTFSGQPGRSTLVQPVAPPEDFIDEPVVVVPRSNGNTVSLRVGDGIGEGGFSGGGDFKTGDGPTQASNGIFNEGSKIVAGASGSGSVPALTDVVTANKGGDSFSLLVGQSDGTFAPHVEFSLLPNNAEPVAIQVGDFNNDLHDDVAVAGNAGVSIFLGDGAGNFPVSTFTPVPHLTDLALGFVDGDAFLDVVTASGREFDPLPPMEEGFATVLLGNGDGTLTNSGSFASGKAIVSVLLGQLDGAGGVDALLSIHQYDGGPMGEPQGVLDLYLGDGLGSFAKSAVFAGHVVPSTEGIHPTYGSLADVDNDTFLDAVYTSSTNISLPAGSVGQEEPPVVLTVLRNDQAGGFDISEQGTAYVGKGVAPILEDVIPNGVDNLDSILVWFGDTNAGQGGTPGSGTTTYVAALAGDGTASFTDPAPNQFPTGDEPGDGTIVDTGLGLGGPDFLVPNRDDNSVSVLLGDGSGGVLSSFEIQDVDTFVPPPSGVSNWVGGPRSIATPFLDDDAFVDLIVESRWEDRSTIAPNPAVFASLVFYLSDGVSGFVRNQTLHLARGGEFGVADMDKDGEPDVVVTQRTGAGGPDQLEVYRGVGGGTVTEIAELLALPAGTSLGGGLLLTDVNGDDACDIVTTIVDGNTGEGLLLVYEAGAESALPTFTVETYVIASSWPSVRKLALGDVTGDLIDDIVIGADDGSLFLAEGAADGSFSARTTNPQAAATGGGAVAIADVNGDGQMDILSSTSVQDGNVDEAFVRALLGTGGGQFIVQAVPGLSSTGDRGALCPLLGQVDDDGAVDLVLVHGTSDRISVLLNRLSEFETYGSGKVGKDGFTPALAGRGFTTPGGNVTIELTDAVGGANGLLHIGIGRVTTGFLHVQLPIFSLPVVTSGTPGATAAGEWSLPLLLPGDSALVGLELTMQVLVRDFQAGLPFPVTMSASNGLALTIVE